MALGLALARCAGRIEDPRRDAMALDAAGLDAGPRDGSIDAMLLRSDARPDALVDVTLLDVPLLDVPRADAAAGCALGQSLCVGRCVPLATDLTNCGACGIVCAIPRATARCSSGACAVGTCEPRFGDCNGRADDGCEASLSSATNCGRCGDACPPSAPVCDPSTVRCVTGCAPSLARCGARCIDTSTDLDHCGRCDAVCAFANATAQCALGRCAMGACLPNFADCDADPANGCETALGTTTNCGRCGDRCDAARPVCDHVARACSAGCTGGATRCGPLCVDTRTDLGHCGACDRRCAFANASASCVAGVCRLARCAPGFADCDADPSNGCETDTRTSTVHCGACSAACVPRNVAAPRCASGACGYSACAAGFGDCDGVAANGCEASVATDALNCGACANSCRPLNASPRCAAGRCGYGACDPGFGDCDGIPANGCETDLRASLSHCGSCGGSCVVANAAAVCSAGVCGYSACLGGALDCDANPRNGCETDPSTDVNHCGGCGRACSAGARCEAGVCR
jgi:hypothetical protein